MQERLKAKPTIRIIAEVVGVSQSTVSRALAGSEAISEETRLRVHEAARRLHYPKIRQGKRPTRMIGVVVSALNNSFYVNFLDYLHDALRDLSFHMTLIIDSLLTVEDVAAFQPIIDNVLDGIIFTTATIDSEVVPTLSRRNFPIVLAVRSVDGLEIDKVVLDDFRVGEEAARHLYELGHRRIGFMMGPRNVSTSRDRFAGALRYLELAGAPPLEEFCVWGSYTHASGYSGALQMLERPEGRPTAIIAGNDTVALGVLEATHRLGLHVPRDISVVGCDDIPMAESAFIGLTTVRPPIEEMARIVARRVVDRVSDPTGPVHTDILPISLVRRATTGPALPGGYVPAFR